MSTFVVPGTQMVIGNRDYPKKVITGPCRFQRWRQHIHGQVSIIPKWSTFTFEELTTATQTPVTLRVDCNWSRNLANLPLERLNSAVRVSNDDLEAMLRKNLGIIAQYHVNHYPADQLVGDIEATDQQLATLQRYRRRLVNSLIDEMKRRLGGLGLVINQLEINLTLPARLQQDIEDLWRLQQYQQHMSNLSVLKLAQAIAKGQPAFNFLVNSQETGQAFEAVNIFGPAKTVKNGHH